MKKASLLIKRFTTDYAWRAAVLLFCSIVADFSFAVYYAATFFVRGRDLWHFFMLCFYLTLLGARIMLLSLYRRRGDAENPSFETATGVPLVLLGGEVIALAVSAYGNGTLITLSNAAVITNTVLAVMTNGMFYRLIRFVVKFIVPFTGRRRMRERTVESDFFRCKKLLSRSESLFMLCLLVNRIFALKAVTPAPAHLIAHLIAFLAVGFYAAGAGIFLFARAYRREKQKADA